MGSGVHVGATVDVGAAVPVQPITTAEAAAKLTPTASVCHLNRRAYVRSNCIKARLPPNAWNFAGCGATCAGVMTPGDSPTSEVGLPHPCPQV